MRLVILSDTHGSHQMLTVPSGDIVIHAGDMTHLGSLEELHQFAAFLRGLPHRHKLVIAGNHDWCFQQRPCAARAILHDITYLQDEAAVIGGIRFYGSPWQPQFEDWAFNLPRGEALRRKWCLIPDDTQVLVTHCPPLGYLDEVREGARVGCADLRDRVHYILPPVHCFGHIHEGAGILRHDRTLFVNASICDADYQPRNNPVVLRQRGHDWEPIEQ